MSSSRSGWWRPIPPSPPCSASVPPRPNSWIGWKRCSASSRAWWPSTRTWTAITVCCARTTRNCSIACSPPTLPRPPIPRQTRSSCRSSIRPRRRGCRSRQTGFCWCPASSLAGIGGGIAFTILLGQLDRSFSTVDQLRELGLPVLGGISTLGQPPLLQRMLVVARFSAAVVALVGVYGGLMAYILRAAALI